MFRVFGWIIILTRLKKKKLFIEGTHPFIAATSLPGCGLFLFKADHITRICTVSSRVSIGDTEEDTVPLVQKNTPWKQYNNVRCIIYKKDYIFYFRNALSKKGFLLIQRKKRRSHETPFFAWKLKAAFIMSVFLPKKNIIFYEKDHARFEESASRVFHAMRDDKNVYYALSRSCKEFRTRKETYGRRIISPHEFRYLVLLFTARYYIGTELPIHLLSVRSPFRLFRDEICSRRHKFIFLQHGVMYALSLKAGSRYFFRKNSLYNPYKIIVSSEAEANHFIELGGYSRDDLWKTGLAHYDRKRRKPDSTLVTVMLTWRPWDEAVTDVTTSTYFRAIEKILHVLQENSSLRVILHPKVTSMIPEGHILTRYLTEAPIDSVLNETAVLITDYSSVAFDAFYRGSNIIFWWEEKEYCLNRYNNTLLLNEDNVFGDVVTSTADLPHIVDTNYLKEQSSLYLKRYRQLVEFSDDRNTERITTLLRKEIRDDTSGRQGRSDRRNPLSRQ